MTSPTRQWLDALYGRSPGYFTVITFVSGKPTTKWFRTDEIAKVAPAIEKAASKYDVYCSVATYKSPTEKGRGSLRDVQSINGFWADLDIGTEGHKPAARPNPANEGEALAIIADMPEPTAVIHSGGGLQVWWLFDQPWVFDDPKGAQRASNEFQARLHRQAEALGLHVDSVGDLPRILRVPGTQNHKTGNPRPVTLKSLTEHRYPAVELASIGEPETDEPVVPKGFDTWENILEPHGWKKVGQRVEDGATLWVRPGKSPSEGHSAVTDPYGIPVMVNFSGSCGLPVGPGQRLTKFKVWAFLNYGGDLRRAEESLGDLAAQAPDALEERASRFIPLDWKTVFEAKPEEIDWLVEPLVETGRAVAFYSEAKAGKSLLWLEVCARLAVGMTQFTPEPKDTEPKRVLYIDLENNETDIVERLTKMGFTHEQLGSFFYYSFPEIGNLDTKAGGLNVLALALRHNADLVIIDTLSRVVEGEEDDNNTYMKFYRHTGMMLKSRGIAYIRLDHTGKDISKGMRGASAKRDDVDEVWLMTADEDRISLKRTHSRSHHGADSLELRRADFPILHHTKELVTVDELMESPEDKQNREINGVLRELRALGIKRRSTIKDAAAAWRGAHNNVPLLVRKVQQMRRQNQITTQEEEARCADNGTPTGDDQDT